MTDAKILVIDDNAAVRSTLNLVLKTQFSSVVVVGSPQFIPSQIGYDDIDAVLLDMNFGQGHLDGQDGLFWLDRIMNRSGLENPPAVVMITAFGDVSLAVQSLKNGAVDFIEKPWDNNDLISKLNEAILKRRQRIRAAREAAGRQAESDVKSDMESDVKSDGKPDVRSDGRPEEKPRITLEEMERLSILEAIQESGRNYTEAATKLGISRQTLYNKMKRYGIS
ncbi:MAG: response regulator [Bacteroidaceae bacterium]|nr:response regulator [Bacteroidaceae bacterium]